MNNKQRSNLISFIAVIAGMKGYVNVPKSIYCKPCRQCGSRPIIAIAEEEGYIVKCPTDELHYQTPSGLIDIEDWNINNTLSILPGLDFDSMIAC